MKILAITLEWSDCSVIIDDEIVYSASEGRFTRIK